MTGQATSSKKRQRRSPRLEKSIAVQIAGKGTDGNTFVEAATTQEISKHGASLLTRFPFAVGAPVALRRPGAKAVRARVVFQQPAPQPGFHKIGVEFVGEDDYWDFPFPPGWQDPSQAAAPPAPSQAEVRAVEKSTEAVLRKAESVRAQAERMVLIFPRT